MDRLILSPVETPFSGSYETGEVAFLLRQLHLETTALVEREQLIQSGLKHYSEMVGPEDAPGRLRLRLFRKCLETNGARLARDLATLADALAASAVSGGELTIVSLARAGTPMGVLLWHRLRQIAPGLRVAHYSFSVIRDRGADLAALAWILARHSPESLRFVDGWTGKGTMAGELKRSLGAWPGVPPGLSAGLWVPLDACGFAAYAASRKDYLIPSTLLGGTISGLVSRSVLPRGEETGERFHGCVPLDHLRRYDLSRWFVREMNLLMAEIPARPGAPPNASGGAPRQEECLACLARFLGRHGMADANLLKPGIGETVRVLLRRLPQVVYLHPDAEPTDAVIIRQLADQRDVPVILEPTLAFDALAVIAPISRRSAKTL